MPQRRNELKQEALQLPDIPPQLQWYIKNLKVMQMRPLIKLSGV